MKSNPVQFVRRWRRVWQYRRLWKINDVIFNKYGKLRQLHSPAVIKDRVTHLLVYIYKQMWHHRCNPLTVHSDSDVINLAFPCPLDRFVHETAQSSSLTRSGWHMRVLQLFATSNSIITHKWISLICTYSRFFGTFQNQKSQDPLIQLRVMVPRLTEKCFTSLWRKHSWHSNTECIKIFTVST